MDHEDLIAKIKRLHDLLAEANKRAIAQYDDEDERLRRRD